MLQIPGAVANPCPGRLRALVVSPPDSEVEVGEGRLDEVRFGALGERFDGSVAGVEALWSVDPPGIGALDGEGVWRPTGALGGEVRVRARADGLEAEARLGVALVSALREGGAPPDAAARFDAETPRMEDSGLRLRSPADGAQLRADPATVSFSWDGGGHSLFRLRFKSAAADVSVYTTRLDWAPDAELWRTLARSNAGRPLLVVLEAEATDGVVQRAPPIEVFTCLGEELCNGLDDDCDGTVEPECRAPLGPSQRNTCDGSEGGS